MESAHTFGRFLALITSVFVSLASGTPYLYGIYAPQLVQRVGLSTSDAATISLAVTIGSGLGGLPAGLLIDRYGPQKSILLGSLCIFLGYFALNRIYAAQIGSLFLVCVAMALVGFGSVTSFFAGLKAVQANFPNHRGTAGALPVGAYGLAATLFSLVGAAFFSDDTAGLLAFLAYFCGSVAFVGSWFVRIFEPKVLGEEGIMLVSESGTELAPQHKANSLRGSFSFWGIGNRTPRSSVSLLSADAAPLVQSLKDAQRLHKLASQTTIGLNLVFAESAASSDPQAVAIPPKTKGADTPSQVIKNLLHDRTFITHYVIMSLLSGIGQTYIYTVGFIVRAQYAYAPGDLPPASLQALQVSTISLASFTGRVVAGVLSDYIYKTLRAQRQWVILATIGLLGLGQVMLIWSNSLHSVTVISLIIGGSYGLLNGTYPAIIADTFGTKSFTTAWGLMCSGPLMILFGLEKYFGFIFDHQSDEAGVCNAGRDCYRGAFEMSTALCVLALAITLALMYVKRRGVEV